MTLTELVARLLLSYIILLILTRFMGRKEISQLTFFNFVSAVSIGTIGASLATDSTMSIRNGLIALGAWALFTVLLGLFSIKSAGLRKLENGQPIILVTQGQLDKKALRKVRMDMESFLAMLRTKDIFSFKEVEYAIFETSGKLSVLPIESKQTATKLDVSAKPGSLSLYPHPFPVITDGTFQMENLARYNIDRQQIERLAKAQTNQPAEKIFYGEMQTDGSLYIII